MNAMGRLNSSTEIIPIQGPSASRRNDFKFKTNFRPKQPFRHPYFVDPSIIPRVKQYLEEHKDSVYVDINAMVDDLQKKYRDYGRRKRSAFKQTVEKAFGVVLHQYGLTNELSGDVTGDINSDSSDDEMYSEDVSFESNNSAAGQLTNMYMSRPSASRQAGGGGDGDRELINISSDEDDPEGKEPSPGPGPTPGPGAGPASAAPCPIKLTLKPKPAGPGPSPSSGGPNPANPASFSQLQDMLRSKSITVTSASGPKTASGTPTRGSAAGGGAVQPPQAQSTPVSVGPSAGIGAAASEPRSKKRKAASSVGLTEGFGNGVKRKRVVPQQESKISFQDLGGISSVLEDVSRLLMHVRHPEVYRQLGVPAPRGFLLHGPPGCGKTLLAHAIAGELGLPLVKVSAPELVAGVSGESEERVRELFEQAVEVAPCVLFLDEVDAIAPHRVTAQREMERRIVAQLLTCLDELGRVEGGTEVLVIGATNRPDALDPALRRAGRFDREVCLGIPDEVSREQILHVLCAPMRLMPNFDFKWVARHTPGFVGADLSSLAREAALAAVNRLFADLQKRPAVTEGPKEKEHKEQEKPAAASSKAEIKQEEVASSTSSVSTTATGTEPNKKKDDAESTNEVIDISDRDTPAEEGPSSSTGGPTPAKETKECEDDDIRIEAEVSMDVEEAQAEAGQDGQDVEVISQQLQVHVLDGTAEAEASGSLAWLRHRPPVNDAQLQNLFIGKEDFEVALRCVQPSAKREGFATVPDVTWEDVGSLKDTREELQMAILAPVRHPEKFEALGLAAPTGVLLCGPPGCGKTLLAKAIANEAGINFISVKGPELLNMYVGESEKAVRQCFQRARNSAPCVIFFDELDALCPKRSESREGGATMRVVNQLLTEMDGVEGRRGVFLLAASNRPDILDPAVLRPGRLDKILYVGLPGPDDRADILRALTKSGTRPRLSADVELGELGRSARLDGYSGADLAALVREAGLCTLRELMQADKAGMDAGDLQVASQHFEAAITRIRPSVPLKDQRRYEELRRLYTAVPGAELPPAPTCTEAKAAESATPSKDDSMDEQPQQAEAQQAEPQPQPQPQ